MKNKLYFTAVLLAVAMSLCFTSCVGQSGAVVGGEQVSPELLYSLAEEQWGKESSSSLTDVPDIPAESSSAMPGTTVTVTVSVTQSTKAPEESDAPPVTSAAITSTTATSSLVTPGPEPTVTSADDTGENQPEIVYWSDSGSVYHVKSNCSALSNAKQVHAGSLEEALHNKKLRECSKCFDGCTPATSAETTEKPQESSSSEYTVTNDAETVFWAESGTVYHLRKTCPALAHSSEIFSGTVKEALGCNKEKLCARCAQK